MEKQIWTKPEYAAADQARNAALRDDPNDQMSALAMAVDAALAVRDSRLEQAFRVLRAEALRPGVRLVHLRRAVFMAATLLEEKS